MSDVYESNIHANARQQVILQLLERQSVVRVAELCERFGVSDMTVRRDLQELEQAGLIRRTYGGAVSARGRSFEPPFPARAATNQAQKQRIGQMAASLVQDGDSVALDVGTTTLEVARALRDKHNLTVVTHSLPIAQVLANHPLVRVIVVGGVLRSGELSLIGHLAERAYREFYVDKLFLGVGGLSLKAGLTEFNLEDALVKQAMLQSAKERIVVADASKLERVAFAFIGPLTGINTLVTDADADAQVVRQIEEAGVRVMLA
ncbi:MAG: DeoR/GlpR transcriptional regulator [Chloroflexi bacterium]|uniref:DeoR/GlpR transcriptional regulator n=1 Tax=Candidatus Thermofonsia Clade 3 bacterium TaxID=2364212 RepID=A0A2M8QGV4_9CHLR|nr:MAG: DeoR/GlpR transcriptional regulator [Candidatus Thermofonsia Clade 3 bacterium]RMG63455.1 MAG: DeoR/GlpR transcriptional regulator [Chloroflexota bacterium]